jgi:hypothetical protein
LRVADPGGPLPREGIAACSFTVTGVVSVERSAATATDLASLGSFLFTALVFNSRTRAASFG